MYTRKRKYKKIREIKTTKAAMNLNPFDTGVPLTTCDSNDFDVFLRTFFSENFNEKQSHFIVIDSSIQRFEEKYIGKFKDSYGDGRHTTVIIGD